MNNKRKVRDLLRLIGAICFLVLYIPHLVCYALSGAKKNYINSDLLRLQKQISLNLPLCVVLLYMLHNNRYYRSLFYYRIGAIISLLISVH